MSEKMPTMPRHRPRRVRKILLLFGLPVVGSIVGNIVYDYSITPAIGFLPTAPLVLYNMFMTAFLTLFLIGIILSVWESLSKGWKRLTRRELRNQLRESIAHWPSSKWDLVPVIVMTYFIATIVPLMGLTILLQRGQLSAAISPEDAQELALFIFMPFAFIFLVISVRLGLEAYRDFKIKWVSGTHQEKVIIVASVVLSILAWFAIMIGEITGWNDLLWFNSIGVSSVAN